MAGSYSNISNLTGQMIGQYDIRDLIGQGGMGAVYRAYQPSLKRDVAIKVLPPALAMQTDYMERFTREAQTAAALEHPSIVPIYDYGAAGDLGYVVMRLLTGGSLADRLRQSGAALPLDDVVRVVRDVASALEYAHARGVIHRDIKANNVMFDERGNPYLVDFGIAHLLNASTSLTGTGVAMGTPMYMSPEQWRGDPLTPAADQYSLGVLAFLMLTGQMPFDASTPYALMHKHLHEPVPTLRVLRADLPDSIQSVLVKALAKEPAERYPTATDFATALGDGLLTSATLSTGMLYAPPKAAAPARDATMLPEPPPRPDAALPQRGRLDADHTPPAPIAAPQPAASGQGRQAVRRASDRKVWLNGVALIGVLLAAVVGVLILSANNPGLAVSAGLLLVAAALITGGVIVTRRSSQRSTGTAFPAELRKGLQAKDIQSAYRPGPAPYDPNATNAMPAEPIPFEPPPPASEPVSEAVMPASTPALDSVPVHTGEMDMMKSVLIELESMQIPYVTEDIPLHDDPGVQLTIMSSDYSGLVGRSYRVLRLPFTIGRLKADLNLDDDQSVSRQHARIEQIEGQFCITDQQSAQGVEVDGKRIAADLPVKLMFGTTIKIGGTTFKFMRETPPAMPNLEGELINGRYRVGKLLNKTGKSAVYQARDETMARDVAVKVLSPDLAAYPGYIEQFIREARTAADLRHPNIVTVYDYGAIEHTSYIVMQLLEGDSLARRLKPESLLSLAEIGAVLASLADALDYAHRQGVVHSGIKPSVVLFDQTGEPYLTDFAVAQTAGQSVNVVGAPAFMAPEQWNNEPATASVDQYALALLAYLMVTGEPPFVGTDPSEYKDKHLRKPVPVAHRVAAENGRADVPETLSAVLQTALAKKPGDRYQSVIAFAQAFSAALQAERRRTHPQVFISYRRLPSAMLAQLLEAKLKPFDIDAYVDTRKLDGGGPFPSRLLRAIEESDVFVCLLADTTFDSEWVLKEIVHAHTLGKTMIPIFQESFEPSRDLTDAALLALLNSDGVHVMDRKNVMVDESIGRLARMVKESRRL